MARTIEYLLFTVLITLFPLKIRSNLTVELDNLVTRIAFGSCNHAEYLGIWNIMQTYHPDKLILLGDNIYADKRSNVARFTAATVDDLQYQYGLLKNDLDFTAFVDHLGGMNENVIATYDDHDYGVNDGDRTYSLRNESKEIFFDFFQVPSDDPRRLQAGVYTSKIFNTTNLSNFTYKVIVLDTRYNKDPYNQIDGDFLGDVQWKWLQAELADTSVDLILLGSSIQVLPTGKVVEESWSRFPKMRERLLRTIMSSPVQNIFLLSGDIHTAEVLQAKCGGGPLKNKLLIELTASGFTHTFFDRAPMRPELLMKDTLNNKQPSPILQTLNGYFKYVVYHIYQLLLPHFYRESPSDHYSRRHFGLLDIMIDPNSPEKKILAFRVINSAGVPVITRQFPLFDTKVCLNNVTQEPTIILDPKIDDENSICEPFWGRIPEWRLWLCVGGLSLIPVLSIGCPLSLLVIALRFIQLKFLSWRR